MITNGFALVIALLRAREAGAELTDEYVLRECEAAKVDPSPVMLLVQRKAQAAWPMIVEHADGTRRLVGARLSGVWFAIPTRYSIAIDTPEVREAVEMVVELDGIPVPRSHASPDRPLTIYPHQIAEG